MTGKKKKKNYIKMNAHKNKRKFGHLQLYQDEWTKNTNIPDKQTKKTYILLLYHQIHLPRVNVPTIRYLR